MRITIYTSSSDAIDERYFAAARDLAGRLAHRGDEVVYGGTAVGVMGALAGAMRAEGGRVTGILPQLMADRGLGDQDCDELIVTPDMAQRKQAMIARADAFVVLPGGFGTLEEFLEVLTLKQLGYHAKPIILLDLDGFYQPLLTMFEGLFGQGFAKREYAALYRVAPDVAAVVDELDAPDAAELPAKWF